MAFFHALYINIIFVDDDKVNDPFQSETGHSEDSATRPLSPDFSIEHVRGLVPSV
jgi:hypothetical protein